MIINLFKDHWFPLMQRPINNHNGWDILHELLTLPRFMDLLNNILNQIRINRLKGEFIETVNNIKVPSVVDFQFLLQ